MVALHYRENGRRRINSTYTNYSFKFKMDVLNYMNEIGASFEEDSAVYNIPSPSTIAIMEEIA